MKKEAVTKQWWYKRWDSMKQRCYNPKSNSYKWYGAKGVYVCDEWLENPWAYGKWVEEQRMVLGVSVEEMKKYQVDKDTLGGGYYGPETCILCSKSDNLYLAFQTDEARKTIGKKVSKPVRCIETGEVFPSGKACAEAMGVKTSNLSNVLQGKLNRTGGFTFEYVEKEEN